MSVRVIARIRPLLPTELLNNNNNNINNNNDNDIILSATSDDTPATPTNITTTTAVTATVITAAGNAEEHKSNSNINNVVRVPNPKNGGEDYRFRFHGVYDSSASQQAVFEKEVAPTIKHLFNGFDITIFAYGVTGTGKTHTMRGGKALADRGVIPRLLSGIYRRARKLEKDGAGSVAVEVGMSYYEIYNDKVFDLFEASERRTGAGLALRDNGGKTIVVGLTERPCESLKEFERLYDGANVNRSTSATKLNAQSSRSHAILRVKVTVTTGSQIRISTASAIDLAGSEDNRRTENGKERLVESASINKSLFVLAQCVEAIGKKQPRIPYRESKMTRILSLGQNNGLTIMILNLAPLRSYHLDTLSSLNFANRTKKVEVRDVENEPVFKGCARPVSTVPTGSATSMLRQPLRPLASTIHNASVRHIDHTGKTNEKPAKDFSVYSDMSKIRQSNPTGIKRGDPPRRVSARKRPSDTHSFGSRPLKVARPSPPTQRSQPSISKEAIEDLVEKKVGELLAARALDHAPNVASADISDEVQKRLEHLEQRIEDRADERSEGLTFLLMAKQHHVRGEDSSALKMYELATKHFPENTKLQGKISKLKQKLQERRDDELESRASRHTLIQQKPLYPPSPQQLCQATATTRVDLGIHSGASSHGNGVLSDSRAQHLFRQHSPEPFTTTNQQGQHTPRTKALLAIINTCDPDQIKQLPGVGPKKAQTMVHALWGGRYADEEDPALKVRDLATLAAVKGVGAKSVERMRAGCAYNLW